MATDENFLQLAIRMKGTISITNLMAKETTFGSMALNMRAIGWKELKKELESGMGLEERHMKVNGEIIRQMGWELYHIVRMTTTKVTGRISRNMERVKIIFQMVMYIEEVTKMAYLKDRVFIFGLRKLLMKEHFAKE